ncbi:13634_t:CDS:1 [Ambispora gerdemannii]|uniref:13634_t:CDS:1 n=1 Tax=Ambispora gerdemannii TaxID=144530 RepID=A0A9N9E3Z9_9GLOM|nr:13634_t:CDS:1 [Ambispora gerdemannii]
MDIGKPVRNKLRLPIAQNKDKSPGLQSEIKDINILAQVS